MKKTIQIITLIIGILWSGDLVSQPRIGVKGGLSYSSFSAFEVGVLSEAVNSYTGYNSGIAVCFNLPLGFAIQPELLFVSKGADFTGNSTLQIRNSYLELPVNLQWGLDLLLFRPYLSITPFMGYSLSSSMKVKSGSQISIDPNYFRRVDYGVAIGGGLDVWRLQLSAKYKWSLENLAKVEKMGGITDSVTKQVIEAINEGSYRGFEISICFFF